MTEWVYWAGIGSRETPADVMTKMTEIAQYLATKGWVLRSGGAKGADTAFEAGYLIDGVQTQIFYPTDHLPLWTSVFTEHFHPNPKALMKNNGLAHKLMSRNAMQILGRDGNTPVEFVVCWTKDGKASGGTAQAIKIAEFYDIPVFNLKNEGSLDKLRAFLKTGGK